MKKTALFLLLTSIALTSCKAKIDYRTVLLDWKAKIIENEKYNTDYKDSLVIFTGFLGTQAARIILETTTEMDRPKFATITFHSEVCINEDVYQTLSFSIYAWGLEAGDKFYCSIDVIAKPYNKYNYLEWRDDYKYFIASFMLDVSSYSRGVKPSYDHVYDKMTTPTEKMIAESEQVTADLLFFTVNHFQTWIQSNDFETIFPSFIS